MTLQDVERSVLALCFREEPSGEILEQLGDRKVWLLYRDMVRDRLRQELKIALPRTCRTLGAERIDRLLAAHLENDPPRTRFFREVPLAFARSSLPRVRADATLPAFAGDLLAYEAALWEVSDLDAGAPESAAELSFERPLRLSGALRLLALQHAVHERAQKGGGYRGRETLLCVHRAADTEQPRAWPVDKTTFAVLSAATAQPGVDASLAATLQRVGAEQGVAVDAAFVDRFCTTLSRFIEAGIVLGSA